MRPAALASLLIFALNALAGDGEASFARAKAALHDRCAIPVLFPEKLPDLGQGRDPVYAVVDHADKSSYSVYLAFTPDCNGASFCRLGTVTGKRGGSSAPLRGKAVALQDAIRGTFTRGSCGAGCADSFITWQQGAITYSAGLKGGASEDVLPLARAMIESSK